MDLKLNFLNFIALPITFGIGCEYPFNVYDRSRLLAGHAGRRSRAGAGSRGGGALQLHDGDRLLLAPAWPTSRRCSRSAGSR